MVPGVKRDPAIIYRDQTQTLVSAVAPTSIKFLESVLETEVTPISFPSQKSFPPGAISGKISRVFELIVFRLMIGPLQKSSPLIDWKWFMKFKQSFFRMGRDHSPAMWQRFIPWTGCLWSWKVREESLVSFSTCGWLSTTHHVISLINTDYNLIHFVGVICFVKTMSNRDNASSSILSLPRINSNLKAKIFSILRLIRIY